MLDTVLIVDYVLSYLVLKKAFWDRNYRLVNTNEYV